MITVVGAGPAGLLVAKEASSRGEKVTVYEEHKEVGKPVQCAGLVSRSGLDSLGVDYEDAVLNEISSAKFFSPSGREVKLKKTKGYALVIDRERFDKIIAEEASSEGARIVLGKRVTKIPEGLVVGADGATSQIARSLGIRRRFLIAYQIENKMQVDLDSVELHFGSFAPGFFAWVIPVDEKRARVGLAYDTDLAREIHENYDPRLALKFFTKLRNYPWNPISELGGIIPIYDGKPAVYGNIALVGDAAAQVKASTGGGIAIGGQCARILGRILGEGKPLAEYEREWRARFERELKLHKAAHDFYSRLSDSEFEELVDLVDDELIGILEKYGEMETVSQLIPTIMGYFSRHPLKFMKYRKYAKYVPIDLLF